MSSRQKLMKNLGWNWTGLAAGGLLLAPVVFAQSGANTTGDLDEVKDPVAVEFQHLDVVQLDGNGDGTLQWRELQPRLQEAGLRAEDKDWDQILNEFDEDGDGSLNPQEYETFLVRVGELQQ